MTQTSTYGEYGNRQNEFSYLCAESQAEIVEYCHAVALMMNTARGILAVGHARRDRAHAEALEMDSARDAEVIVTMPSGVQITRGELAAEMAAARAPRTAAIVPMAITDPMYTGFYGVSHFA